MSHLQHFMVLAIVNPVVYSPDNICMKFSRSSIVNAIASGAWFKDLSEDAIDQLAAKSHVKKYSANQFLYLIGEETSDVYCVLSGKARVSITSSDGQEFVLTDIHPSEWLGEASLVETKPRVQEVWVLEESDILVMPADAVLAVAEQHPCLYRNLFVNVVGRTRSVYELMGGMLFYPLRSRLAGRLLDLLQKHGEITEHGVELDMHMSQIDFARMSMGSRQRINKIFRDWVKQGVLAKQGDKYLVHDIEALKLELELDEG